MFPINLDSADAAFLEHQADTFLINDPDLRAFVDIAEIPNFESISSPPNLCGRHADFQRA